MLPTIHSHWWPWISGSTGVRKRSQYSVCRDGTALRIDQVRLVRNDIDHCSCKRFQLSAKNPKSKGSQSFSIALRHAESKPINKAALIVFEPPVEAWDMPPMTGLIMYKDRSIGQRLFSVWMAPSADFVSSINLFLSTHWYLHLIRCINLATLTT